MNRNLYGFLCNLGKQYNVGRSDLEIEILNSDNLDKWEARTLETASSVLMYVLVVESSDVKVSI